MSNRPAAVVRPNEHLPPHPTYGQLLGTGTANVEQLADVLENAERKQIAADQSLSRRWGALRAENALLRIMSDGRLVSAAVDTYDRLLFAAATTDWQSGTLIVGKALGASFDEQLWVSSDFLFARLASLVRAGALETQGDVLGLHENGRWTQAMVRKPA